MGVMIFVLGIVLGSSRAITIPEVDIVWPAEEVSPRYMPRYSHISGQELVMVYVGSSTCLFANDERLTPLVEQAKNDLTATSG